MNVHFCVLGSGSEGNAALLMTPHVHVLIDSGFPPEDLAARMDGTGASWESLDAVVLTHTHGDHLKKKCLSYCLAHGVQFICHERHAAELAHGRYFKRLHEKALVRTYDGAPFDVAGAVVRFHPIRVSHDAEPTFGFRVEISVAGAADGAGERRVNLAYLADLGEGPENFAPLLSDVDLLALEFNHDEEMERRSGRHPTLIQRVMGKHGHLSNRQAADLFRQILERNGNGGPKFLVQLHLSRDCNRAELAYESAQQVVMLSGAQTRVFSSRQDRRGTVHAL